MVHAAVAPFSFHSRERSSKKVDRTARKWDSLIPRARTVAYFFITSSITAHLAIPRIFKTPQEIARIDNSGSQPAALTRLARRLKRVRRNTVHELTIRLAIVG